MKEIHIMKKRSDFYYSPIPNRKIFVTSGK